MNPAEHVAPHEKLSRMFGVAAPIEHRLHRAAEDGDVPRRLPGGRAHPEAEEPLLTDGVAPGLSRLTPMWSSWSGGLSRPGSGGPAGEQRHDDRLATAPPQKNGTAQPTDGIAMDAVKTGTVQVDIDEHEGRTARSPVWAQVNPVPWPVQGSLGSTPRTVTSPRIGDERAVARALSELGRLLLEGGRPGHGGDQRCATPFLD
jgi:hypothetical protein